MYLFSTMKLESLSALITWYGLARQEVKANLNDNVGRDPALNNNMEPLDNPLKATPNLVPEVNGNEEVPNVMKKFC